MKLIGKRAVIDFVRTHPDCEKSTYSLIAEIENASWKTPYDIKERYASASIVGDGNVVFNICGNKYRLWLKIAYQNSVAIIMKIGTHANYNKWEIK